MTNPDTDGEVVELARKMFTYAREGDFTLVRYVQAGVPANMTNESGDTLLMLAAYHGHAEIVSGLIDAGADVNTLNDRGQSPIAGALFKGFDDVVQVLKDAGADLDAGRPSARMAAEMFGRQL